jgi:hypothetical protein
MKKLVENLPFHTERVLKICAILYMLRIVIGDTGNMFLYVCIISTVILTFSVSAYVTLLWEAFESKNMRRFLGNELANFDLDDFIGIVLFVLCMFAAIYTATHIYNPMELTEGTEYNKGTFAAYIVSILFATASWQGNVLGLRLAKEEFEPEQVV